MVVVARLCKWERDLLAGKWIPGNQDAERDRLLLRIVERDEARGLKEIAAFFSVDEKTVRLARAADPEIRRVIRKRGRSYVADPWALLTIAPNILNRHEGREAKSKYAKARARGERARFKGNN